MNNGAPYLTYSSFISAETEFGLLIIQRNLVQSYRCIKETRGCTDE
jgi:hypothetical protein